MGPDEPIRRLNHPAARTQCSSWTTLRNVNRFSGSFRLIGSMSRLSISTIHSPSRHQVAGGVPPGNSAIMVATPVSRRCCLTRICGAAPGRPSAAMTTGRRPLTKGGAYPWLVRRRRARGGRSRDGPNARPRVPGAPQASSPRIRTLLTAAIPIIGGAALIVLWRAPAMEPEAASISTTVRLTTLTSAPTTTSKPPDEGPPFYRVGALPDGTEFHLQSRSEPIGPIERASATIMIDREGPPPGVESTMVFGVVEYLYLPTEFRDYGPGFVLLPAGDWTVRIEILDSATSAFGDEAPAMLLAGIEVSLRLDLPVLTLGPPFRWASDTEGPVPMEVSTPAFVVRRGCGDQAAGCSATRAVQVAPRRFVPTSTTHDGRQAISIEAYEVPRPTADPYYLDPGRLGFRWDPHVLWTGREMVVWSGRNVEYETPLMGGAALDPSAGTWRMLPSPPLRGPDVSGAVWADTRLIVFTREGTAGYDPDTDEWTVLGEGPPYPPRSPGMTVWTGELVATWAPLGIYVFDPVGGTWATLPELGFGGPSRTGGALRVVDGRLYAIGSSFGLLEVAEWTGSEWRLLPEPPGVSDSTMEPGPSAVQSGVADGRLIVWGDRAAAAYDPGADSWTPIAAPPIPQTGWWASGPLTVGGSLLVPSGPDSFRYVAATDQWVPVPLPGLGNETQMVWTGEEVLSWGGCCFGQLTDAWRWRPPGG